MKKVRKQSKAIDFLNTRLLAGLILQKLLNNRCKTLKMFEMYSSDNRRRKFVLNRCTQVSRHKSIKRCNKCYSWVKPGFKYQHNLQPLIRLPLEASTPSLAIDIFRTSVFCGTTKHHSHHYFTQIWIIARHYGIFFKNCRFLAVLCLIHSSTIHRLSR